MLTWFQIWLKKIPQSDLNFESDLPKVNTTLNEKSLTEHELNKAFRSLKKIKLLVLMD